LPPTPYLPRFDQEIANMKRNLVVGLFGSFVGPGMSFILLSTASVHAAGVVTNCTGQGLADAMNAGSGAISFSCGPAPVVITLTQAGGFNVIAGRSYTIDGGNLVTLTGAGANRLFDIQASNAGLTLTKIILTDGNALTGGNQPTLGGAILNEGGQLVLDHVTISNSKSYFAGGAIRDVVGATTTLTNSLIDNNQSQYGGGIDSAGTLTLTNTIVQNNQATVHEGGGLDVGGTVVITNSRFIGNSANGANVGGGGGINIVASGNVTITGSQFSNNHTPTQATDGTGGAIRNLGALQISYSNFNGNSANDGGAICNDSTTSTATLDNVIVDGNSAFDEGGGINNNNGMLTLNNVTLSGNTGGGLFNYATAMLNGTTLSGNSADEGAGIFNLGTVTLVNTTFSGNSAAGQGGGLYNISKADLVNVTFSNNSAVTGGAVYMDIGHTTSLTNTILAYSSAGGNCGGSFTTEKFTLSTDNSCALTGLINGHNPNVLDPLLTPLGTYGGPTLVHMPQPGSPAIAGILGNDAPATDQRGLPRPGSDGSYDIGAVERQNPEDIIFRNGFD
jgi:fibronectin-binding autotransporter adhesin